MNLVGCDVERCCLARGRKIDQKSHTKKTTQQTPLQKSNKNSSNNRPDRITITIAHRLATIQNSDVIYVMNDGIKVEEGSHEELLKRDGSLYSRLWRSSGAVEG